MLKVINGDRPIRPASGFSDTLWESLTTTWVAEDGPESKRRPSASVVLEWLKKDIDHWGNSIVPLIPKEWQESGGYLKCPNKWRDSFTILLKRRVLVE